MPFQVDISVTYNPNELPDKQWSAFCKFDFPVDDGTGYVAQCVLAEGATIDDAITSITSTRVFHKYTRKGRDHYDGAEQNAEGLVN